jgi:ATP-binding protein involved in chromosome partitioning
VTTPQKVAVQDAIKGAEMFRKTDVPLLGCVLNMSSFICPSCGTKSQIGHSFQSLLDITRVELLAEIPFQSSIAEAADAGTPIVMSKPDSPQAIELKKLASVILSKLESKAREHLNA